MTRHVPAHPARRRPAPPAARRRRGAAPRRSARSRWPGPPAAPSAPNGGCAAPPARPGGCAPSSRPRPPSISDHPPATAGNLNPSNDHQEVTMNRTRPSPPHPPPGRHPGRTGHHPAGRRHRGPGRVRPAHPSRGRRRDRRRPRCRPSSSAACPAGRSPSSPSPPRSLAAAVAVLLDRARTTRRHQAAPSA